MRFVDGNFFMDDKILPFGTQPRKTGGKFGQILHSKITKEKKMEIKSISEKLYLIKLSYILLIHRISTSSHRFTVLAPIKVALE